MTPKTPKSILKQKNTKQIAFNLESEKKLKRGQQKTKRQLDLSNTNPNILYKQVIIETEDILTTDCPAQRYPLPV